MTATAQRVGTLRYLAADLATTLSRRPRTQPDPDPIEQWPAQLRDMPAAAELTTPTVNSVNSGGAV